MYNEEFKDFILTLFFFRTVRELGLLVASFDSWKYPLNMSKAFWKLKTYPGLIFVGGIGYSACAAQGLCLLRSNASRSQRHF